MTANPGAKIASQRSESGPAPQAPQRGPHKVAARPSSDWPMLDVSLVTYNSSAWLPAFFQSLIAQNYPCRQIRVLATDNGSTDDTFARLEDFLSQHGSKFAQVALTRQKNVGFGGGHNENLRRATSDYFLVTNVDLEFEPGTLTRLVEHATTSPADVASWECRQKPYEHPKNYNPFTLDTAWSSSACVLLRTASLRQVGGYDEKLFMYGEDVDLSYRLRDQGYRLQYSPRAVCWHYAYATPGEFKKTQFFGSSLANMLLRLRFGSLRAMCWIPLLCARICQISLRDPKLIPGLIRLLGKLFILGPRFLLSRHKSQARFPFRRFDYELAREGAFVELLRTTRTSWPLVSVIVRTYGGRIGYLRESVQSVLNQTYPNVELLVIEDGTTGFAREFLDRCQEQSSVQIRYLTVPKAGRCRTGNEGLAQANGTYLVFLDDDDYFFADHLETLVTHLLDNPQYAAAYGLAWEVTTEVLSTDPLEYREGPIGTPHRQPFCRGLLWQRNFIPIQANIFHRRLYERYGGFDEDLEMLEDWNLWTRYSLEDDFVLVPKTTSGYRVPADPQQQRDRTTRLHSYYPLAVEKQEALSIAMNPRKFSEMANEVSRVDTWAVAVHRHFPRLSRIPFARKLYHLLRDP